MFTIHFLFALIRIYIMMTYDVVIPQKIMIYTKFTPLVLFLLIILLILNNYFILSVQSIIGATLMRG